MDEYVPATKSGIYLIRNCVTAMVYIGSTRNFTRRWNQHRSKLRRGIHANRHLQNAWKLYGEDAFEWLVAEYLPCDDALLKEREIHFLDEVYPNKRQKYNVALGPIGGHRPVFSDEMRANMSKAALRRGLSPKMREYIESRRGRPGLPANEEQRANLLRGHLFANSPEANEKRRAAWKRPPTERELAFRERRKGRPWSVERRARHEAQKGRPRTPAQLAADERLRGKQHTEPHKDAIAAGLRRNYGSDPTAADRRGESIRAAHARMTPEQKAAKDAAISAAKKGWNPSPETRWRMSEGQKRLQAARREARRQPRQNTNVAQSSLFGEDDG